LRGQRVGAKKAFALVTALVLAGCATRRPIWNKPGATQQSFAADKYECQRENQGGAVAVPVGNAAVAVPVTNWQLYNACMEARGYTRQ
jgi:hypothetical protein